MSLILLSPKLSGSMRHLAALLRQEGFSIDDSLDNFIINPMQARRLLLTLYSPTLPNGRSGSRHFTSGISQNANGFDDEFQVNESEVHLYSNAPISAILVLTKRSLQDGTEVHDIIAATKNALTTPGKIKGLVGQRPHWIAPDTTSQSHTAEALIREYHLRSNTNRPTSAFQNISSRPGTNLSQTSARSPPLSRSGDGLFPSGSPFSSPSLSPVSVSGASVSGRMSAHTPSISIPHRPYAHEVDASRRIRSPLVDLDSFLEFVFPKGQLYPKSVGRMLIFALHGPLSVDGQILGGRLASRTLTDIEINAEIKNLEREDLVAAFGNGQRGSHDDEIMTAVRGLSIGKYPSMTKKEVLELILPRVKVDKRNRVLFSDLQDVILQARVKRIENLKKTFPDVLRLKGRGDMGSTKTATTGKKDGNKTDEYSPQKVTLRLGTQKYDLGEQKLITTISGGKLPPDFTAMSSSARNSILFNSATHSFSTHIRGNKPHSLYDTLGLSQDDMSSTLKNSTRRSESRSGTQKLSSRQSTRQGTPPATAPTLSPLNSISKSPMFSSEKSTYALPRQKNRPVVSGTIIPASGETASGLGYKLPPVSALGDAYQSLRPIVSTASAPFYVSNFENSDHWVTSGTLGFQNRNTNESKLEDSQTNASTAQEELNKFEKQVASTIGGLDTSQKLSDVKLRNLEESLLHRNSTLITNLHDATRPNTVAALRANTKIIRPDLPGSKDTFNRMAPFALSKSSKGTNVPGSLTRAELWHPTILN